MADTLKNLQYMTINKGMKHIIGGDKMSHFPDMRIQDDSTLYAKLLEKKHSTFDRSKFTVVGSPTITDDGVASGFSSTDYVKTNNPNISDYQNYEIDIPFNPSQINCMIAFKNYIIGLVSGSTWESTYGKIALFLGDGSTWNISAGSAASSQIGVTQLVAGTNYIAKIIRTPSQYILKLLNLDTGVETTEVTVNSTANLGNTSNIELGSNGMWTDRAQKCTHDLKHFSITVDGKEVFNGNKTGIDNIKPDNYEVVGNPVISEDGVASGFSGGNYLTKSSLGITPTKDWKVALRLQMPSYTSSAYRMVTTIGNAGNTANRCYLRNTSSLYKKFGIEFYGVASGTIYLEQPFDSNGVFKFNTCYDIEFGQELSNGVYKTFFKYKGIDDDVFTEMSDTSAISFQNISQLITIGYWNTEGQTGAEGYNIDLNAFKIYVDGNLVYQPTLRIPYTQSKTDEKIVDAIYRDRVQDMYEQFGYTHYYTIGDEPEKYNVQVVGNPTLVGGIASGFSDSNYLIANVDIKNSWKIKGKLNCTNVAENTYGRAIISNNDSANAIYMSFRNSRVYLELKGETAIVEGYLPNITVSNNTDYDFEFGYNGTKYYLLLNNNEVWSVNSNVAINTVNTLGIGTRKTNRNAYFEGSIDLSKFSIEVDGKEVFRGYEPAITDAFTLATNKGTDIIESYSDGEGTYYEVRADLVQRCVGIIPINTTEVNYPREFRDEKNIVQVAYFNVGESTATPTIAHIAPKVQTKSGFTIGAATNLSRNYYAEGKAVLG